MAVKVLRQIIEDGYAIYNGDCVDVISGIPDDKIGFSIYSPPFISLYTFSDSDRDMSNCVDDRTFWDHYRYLIKQAYRATMPGRLCAVHCMDLPVSKLRDGHIGLRDFPGMIVRMHEDEGWIYHSRVCVWKNPVTAMQRTKAIGLLHKQIVKDSAMSRMGVADYIVVLRKPGDNPDPVGGAFEVYYGSETSEDGPLVTRSGDIVSTNYPGDSWYSVAVWQRYASPVWMDINQSDVLSHRVARAEADDRHISPLQLTPIRRCIDLWSNPGDTVFSPFAGIGSELYCAVEMGRKAIGAELKESYYEQAIANLKSLEGKKVKTASLFDLAEATQ